MCTCLGTFRLEGILISFFSAGLSISCQHKRNHYSTCLYIVMGGWHNMLLWSCRCVIFCTPSKTISPAHSVLIEIHLVCSLLSKSWDLTSSKPSTELCNWKKWVELEQRRRDGRGIVTWGRWGFRDTCTMSDKTEWSDFSQLKWFLMQNFGMCFSIKSRLWGLVKAES